MSGMGSSELQTCNVLVNGLTSGMGRFFRRGTGHENRHQVGAMSGKYTPADGDPVDMSQVTLGPR